MENIKTIVYILLAVTLFAFLNPDAATHRAAVRDYLGQKFSAYARQSEPSLNNSVAYSIASDHLDRVVNESVTVSNFYLLSLTKINSDGVERIAGVGILGKVFIVPSAFPAAN